MKINVPIEYIHLLIWYILMFSWVLSYFLHGIEMLLAWAIFWCMYISMSDIWECSKCWNELCSFCHRNRRVKAYLWLILSLILFIYYYDIRILQHRGTHHIYNQAKHFDYFILMMMILFFIQIDEWRERIWFTL